MINDFDKKIGGEAVAKHKEEIKSTSRYNQTEKIQKNKNEKNLSEKKEGKFLNNKRPRKTSEEIQKEKEEKLLHRKKTFRNLNKKTPRGQPVMKFQMEHLFNKIKNKIQKGTI